MATPAATQGASGKPRARVKFFSPHRLYPKQFDAFAGGGPNVRFRLCQASSGSGKTFAMGDVAGQYTQYLKAGETFLWLAPSYTQAAIGMNDMLSKMPEDVLLFMEKYNYIGRSSGNMKIDFSGIMSEFGFHGWGGQVNFRTAEKPELLQGGRNQGLAMDEASLCAMHSKNLAITTISKDGEENPAWMWGNVVDRFNWFYLLCREMEHENKAIPWEEQRYHYTELSYTDALLEQQKDVWGNPIWLPNGLPRMVQTPQAIEDARFMMRDEPGRFEMMYENTPMGEMGRPFPDSLLEQMSTYCMCKEDYKDPKLCAICQGLSFANPVCGSMDVARTVDMNCITAVDAIGRACRFDYFYSNDWNEINDRFAAHIPLEGSDVWWYDCTGVGDAAYKILIDRHPRLKDKVFPFVKNDGNKSVMGQNLIRAGLQGEVLLPRGDMTDQLARMEAERTKRGIKYEAKAGFHDDIYDSIAMTVMLLYFGNVGNKGRVPRAFGDRQPLGASESGALNSFEQETLLTPHYDRPAR